MKKEDCDWPGGKNTLDSTADLSSKRPQWLLVSSKKKKMQQIKTMFFTGTSKILYFSVKKGPICFCLLKKEYYFLCVLPTADKYFCGWTFKEKHVFQSLAAFYFLALHNCRREWAVRKAGVVVPFTICLFFPDPVLLTDIRQNMFFFIKKGNYSYFFCWLKKIYIFFCSKGQADDLYFIVNNILRHAGIFQIDSWMSACEGLWFWRVSAKNIKNCCN